MNANELANKSFMELWDSYTSKKMECEDLHEMLSQQQAEIEALKQIIDANNLNQNIGQFVKPTNKPVAWMDYLEHSDVYDLNVSGRGIPLYTHPAELTDEEIKTTTITEVLNYFEEARYELDADFVFKLKKHFQICGEEE